MKYKIAGGLLALATVAAAAAVPKALVGVSPGLWEITGQPLRQRPAQLCIADLASLAQFEHRRSRCTRVVIRDLPTSTEIHYTCTDGGFGRSTIKRITTKSLRIDTQGISGSYPFNYVMQARRIGECQSH